jgi:hypothetical protein
MRAVVVWVVLVGGCTGIENVPQQLYPLLSVLPETLEFGDVCLPRTGELPVYVKNARSATLEVTGELRGEGYTLAEPIDLALRSEEEAEVLVTFTPETFKDYAGTLVLTSNDEEHPTWEVPIHGKGIDCPFPDIEIEPARTIERETDTLFEPASMSFQIHNRGDDVLELGTITLAGAAEFVERITPSDQTVKPGEYTTMVVDYTPTDLEGDNATVTIPSNDPIDPELTVLLLGNGGGDFEHPVAVIDCPTEILLTGPEYTHLDGSQSYDPNGFTPLEYQWKVLTRPQGSDEDIQLDPDTTPTVDLYTDVAGTWEVELVVTNQIGTSSEPAVCVMEARPEDEIHVELSWSTPSADVDLHLVQGGSQLFDVPQDCNYCNPNPDWGTNSDDDDPRLDIDDQGGYGPENINIFTAEAGTYDVKVHYFAPHGDGPTTATVKVWLGGTLMFDGNRVLQNDDVWSVGTIVWPDALFTVDASANVPADSVGCTR